MKIIISQGIFMIIYLSCIAFGKLNKISNNLQLKVTDDVGDIFDVELVEEKDYKFLETSSAVTNTTANTTANVTTNGTTAASDEKTFPAIVDKAPYKPVDCSQTVILKAQRLVNDNDYAVKKDAFFTLSAIRINIFDQMNADSLVNSKGMEGLNQNVDVLKGTNNCLFFHDMLKRHHNISMCIDDKNTTSQILDTFTYFQKCSQSSNSRLSKLESLEKLLNTLNNPEQDQYKIPNFKRALSENLAASGFIVTESGSKDAKTNCKNDAKKIVIPKPKILRKVTKYDKLHHLDKSIPLVPGTVPPKENQNVLENHPQK